MIQKFTDFAYTMHDIANHPCFFILLGGIVCFSVIAVATIDGIKNARYYND